MAWRNTCLLLCASLLCLGLSAASTAAEKASAANKKPRPAKTTPPRKTLPRTRAPAVDTVVLRYRSLSSLPQVVRDELKAPARSAASADYSQDGAEHCRQSRDPRVSPCLGILDMRSDQDGPRFSFGLSRSSIGAPKDLLFGPCLACINTDALIEQEKLADVLNQQRRFPLATMGISVGF
ncbi:hypothetical protein [Uliginosibacterium sediminicola]|uniref:Uncharacterized protein n=1 Tax=Uliginosibacterium sediminicola TaxID=2024550 RepID=A0ABU9YWR9_9RHOO